MNLSSRITEARRSRKARQAIQAQRNAVTRELAAYSTPADRMEIELIATRTPGPGADLVLDILNRLPLVESRTAHRLSV